MNDTSENPKARGVFKRGAPMRVFVVVRPLGYCRDNFLFRYLYMYKALMYMYTYIKTDLTEGNG